MNSRFLKLFTTVLPICSLAMMPPRCTGTARVKVTDPHSGIQGEAEIGWSKDIKTAKVSATIPPNSPKQTIQVGGFSIDLPANQGSQPMQFTADCTDPVIVQVPLAWTLGSATVTSPAGTGPLTVVTGALPAAGTIGVGGVVTFTKFYLAEPGTKLMLGDYPPGLGVAGPTSGVAKFRFPPGPQPISLLKYISTGKLTLYTPTGPVTWYPPLDPYVTDFSLVADNAHFIVVDTVSGTECKNAIGTTPSFDLPATDWRIGRSTSLDASALMPGSPTVFVLGIPDLGAPIPFGVGGCKLRVDPTGAALISATASPLGTVTIPISVPTNPWLIGLALAAQVVEFDAPATLSFSNHGKPRIER